MLASLTGRSGKVGGEKSSGMITIKKIGQPETVIMNDVSVKTKNICIGFNFILGN